MKCKVRPFIMEHIFTFYSCLYVFSFRLFSNISQTVLGCSGRRFCRKFQVLSLGNKNDFNHRNSKKEEILKILRGQSFLGHPLVLSIFVRSSTDNTESCRCPNLKADHIVTL